MWFLGKIRESMESAPLELGRHIGKRGEDALFYSKTSLSQNLHTNIITPDNIPEFCLPPRLCKRHLTPEVEMTALHLDSRTATPMTPKNSTCSSTARAKTKLMKEKSEEPSGPERAPRKPLPFSAECYGLAGMYESPNTRRKESLFHSKRPVYTFERRTPAKVKEATPLKKTFSGFLPLFASRSTEAETPSSAKPSRNVKSRSHCLKETVSCPSLIDGMDKSMRSTNNLGLSLPASSCSWSTSEKQPPTLSPPLHPLDFLHCQERLQHEHVLPLQGRGRVRLSAEHATFSNDAPSVFSTIRVRVVSVEGLLDQTERQSLNCAVNLCLTPGKLQQQESATIRNCRFPVFNEDFYFTELSREDLLELRLRLKVLDKATAGALRRGTVIGILCKPLSQLVSSDERV